jgi:nucleosome binding factor SPN SPT16 subunit
LAEEALETLRQNLLVGQPISHAYNKASEFMRSRNQSLTVHSNLGFGIGFNFRDDQLVINATNKVLVAPGMTFHGRIALTGVHAEANRAVVAVGDTFLVEEDGNVREVTKAIQKKYSEISYVLEVEDSSKENGNKKAAPAKNNVSSSEEEEESFDSDKLNADDM